MFEDGREIGVGHGGVAAGDQAEQGAGDMRKGDVGKTGLRCEFAEALFEFWVFPGVDEGDGDGVYAAGVGVAQGLQGGGFVQGLDEGAVHRDAAGDFSHLRVEHAGEFDVEVEQAGAGLVADAQQIREAVVDQQQCGRTFALQQRVGGDGGAHFDVFDEAWRDGCAVGQAEECGDAGQSGVLVALRVFRQEFFGGDLAGGGARHDVREGAAAIDPEMPACHNPRLKDALVDV